MRLTEVASVALLLCAPTEAFSPAARSTLVRTQPLAAPLRPVRSAPLQAPPKPRALVVASSSAAAPQLVPRRVSLARAALWCLASIATLILGTARFAFAAERTLRRASPMAGVAISGDVLKYGFVGGCIAASYFFRKEEQPRFHETPGAVALDPETLKPIEPEPEKARAAAAAPAAAQVDDMSLPETPMSLDDDSAVFGSLQARMQALAAEKAAAAEAAARGDAADEDDDAPPADSTDGWGTGDTAVLERPSEGADEPRGVLDGEPAVEFPPGFPLVDGEVVDNTPAASADQIAMLNRMFGTAEESE